MSPRIVWPLLVVLVVSFFPQTPSPARAVAAPTVRVLPQQFSPNGDGERESTGVSVTLSEAAKLQVRITDSSGKAVAYLLSFTNKAAGAYKFTFTGKVKNSSGSTVNLPEGTYYAEAATQGADGATERRRARFYINNTLRAVSVRSAALAYNTYPSLFSPNGDGVKDGLVAQFNLIRPARAYMRMYTGGRLVHTITASYSTAGVKTLAWNGQITNSAGGKAWAPAGKYIVGVEAVPLDTAAAGRLGYARSAREMFADKSAPSVSTTLSPQTINTLTGQSTKLSYSASQAGYRRVEIKNGSGAVVYKADWVETAPSGSFSWNGRNSQRALLFPGKYTINLYFQDRAGNRATAYPASRTVTVTRDGKVSGSASRRPWNGYWWPMLNTYTNKLYNNPGPMTRYDAYSKATGRSVGAYSWENNAENGHKTTNSARDWWGHCQAWAAAAIMEAQPKAITKRGVSFSQDDAEGLYSETWYDQVVYEYGTKYLATDGRNAETYKDVYPAEFDWAVLYWIGQKKSALMMDLTTGVEVWNYPVYAFSRTSTFSGGKEYVTMTLTRAKPTYGDSGTGSITQKFYYTLQEGTNGVWYNPSGSSVNTHPDYVVKVLGRAGGFGNPYVKPNVLNEIFR